MRGYAAFAAAVETAAVPHRYLNIDEDLDALDRAKALNAGRRRTPTIDLGGRVLVEPSNTGLADALIQRGDLTREELLERVTVQNVGDLERAVRGGFGLLLVLLASSTPASCAGRFVSSARPRR